MRAGRWSNARPFLDVFTQVVLLLGLVLALAPFVIVAIAATHDLRTVNQVPMPLVPGRRVPRQPHRGMDAGRLRPEAPQQPHLRAAASPPARSSIAALSAFSIVYFRYRGRMLIFWLIFITLMLPLEVRIVPTYAVAANVLQPYQAILDVTGISWLVEQRLRRHGRAAVGPAQYLRRADPAAGRHRDRHLPLPPVLPDACRTSWSRRPRWTAPARSASSSDILLPLSRTNMAALCTIMFVWAWNQYLWPLLVTTDRTHGTAVMRAARAHARHLRHPGMERRHGGHADRHAAALLVVILMQRWFVRGLIATEK